MTPSKRKVSSTFKREIYIYLQERIYKGAKAGGHRPPRQRALALALARHQPLATYH